MGVRAVGIQEGLDRSASASGSMSDADIDTHNTSGDADDDPISV